MERKALILAPAAVVLGLAGGYAWSALTAPPAKMATPPKATQVTPPPSPEELPTLEDKQWTAEGDDRPAVHYSGCNEVRAAGKAPLYRSDPGYRPEMDGDGDGIACEPYRGG